MEHERRAMRVGIFAISLAVLWKVLTGGALAPVISFLQKPSTAAFLLSMETGRMARPPAAEAATIPGTTAATTPSTVPPTETPTEEPDVEDNPQTNDYLRTLLPVILFVLSGLCLVAFVAINWKRRGN